MMITKNLHKNQDGIVAIAVSMIILLIVSLMTLAFARLMQREQRQALDRQLSTQAFYAAESGINDAKKLLKSGQQIEKNDCPATAEVQKRGGELFPGTDYTCLLINSALPDLRFSDIRADLGRQFPLQSSNGTVVDRIRIEWERDSAFSNFVGDDKLPPKASWPNDRPEMIRAVVFTRNSVTNNYDSATYFISPGTNAGSSIPYTLGSSPKVSIADCNSAREYVCTFDITGSFRTNKRTSSSDMGDTIVALIGVYRSDRATPVRLSMYNGGTATNNQVLIVNGQYNIDSTGKSNDVFRRLQVRVSQSLDYYYPERAIETTSELCKKFITEPASTIADVGGCAP